MKFPFTIFLLSVLIFILIAPIRSLKTHDRDAVGSGITYPIRLAYVDRINSWTTAGISAGLGVPGYGPDN